uniref:Cytohesin-interacting protein-like n=1 Tax=Sinocyclocheilus anshuiensis TaxID=1608454 RepID=A0A671QLI6_9TELE
MTSNKNFKAPLKQLSSLDSYIIDNSQKKKNILWRRRSFNSAKNTNTEEIKDGTLSRSKKQDNEAFGFEVQTYGLKVKNSSMVEMCTFVCSVQDGSAAETAGLTAGDIILSVNGMLISFLCFPSAQQTLCEKWVELQSLTLQEKRLTRGNLNESSQHPSVDSLLSLSSPTGRSGQRFSSDSSCRSIMTDDSEDGAFMSSVFDDSSPFSPTEPNGGFFRLEGGALRPLTRTRSISLTSSSSSLSPSWENSSSSMFGTLPRRGRKSSVRKHLLKFIPGLNHSVEEEEGN